MLHLISFEGLGCIMSPLRNQNQSRVSAEPVCPVWLVPGRTHCSGPLDSCSLRSLIVKRKAVFFRGIFFIQKKINFRQRLARDTLLLVFTRETVFWDNKVLLQFWRKTEHGAFTQISSCSTFTFTPPPLLQLNLPSFASFSSHPSRLNKHHHHPLAPRIDPTMVIEP